MCRHYRWAHDFWRRMGRKEFYAWVDQCYHELSGPTQSEDSWDNYEHDEWYQRARERRSKLQGR